jgi:hypothetical protein
VKRRRRRGLPQRRRDTEKKEIRSISYAEVAEGAEK